MSHVGTVAANRLPHFRRVRPKKADTDSSSIYNLWMPRISLRRATDWSQRFSNAREYRHLVIADMVRSICGLAHIHGLGRRGLCLRFAIAKNAFLVAHNHENEDQL